MNEIHVIMGQKHTTQILGVLDTLGADWTKVEDFCTSELERGAKNILTGQPLTAEQAEVMEATIGKTVLGRVTVCQGLDFPAYTLTREWDRANSETTE